MVEGGQERPLMGFSEFFPFSLHGHVGGPITFQSTLRRYVSPAYYPISNRLCDDYWYKHCTQLYQSSCKQRSDCKLPWETWTVYLRDREPYTVFTCNIAPLYQRHKQVRTKWYIKGHNPPVLASVHQMGNSCLFPFVISSKW